MSIVTYYLIPMTRFVFRRRGNRKCIDSVVLLLVVYRRDTHLHVRLIVLAW